MTKFFNTEIRTSFNKKYIKIFLFNMKDASKVKDYLETIPCVRKINISNEGKDLTVYLNTIYNAEDAEKILANSLSSFYSSLLPMINAIEETKKQLNKYPISKSLYEEAIQNIKVKGSNRNTLDSLRLALEKVVQEVDGDKSPLERQEKPLSNYLKNKGATPEIRKTIINSLHNLYRYQDDNVKHDSNIKNEDVCFLINQTNNIVNQLLIYKNK